MFYSLHVASIIHSPRTQLVSHMRPKYQTPILIPKKLVTSTIPHAYQGELIKKNPEKQKYDDDITTKNI